MPGELTDLGEAFEKAYIKRMQDDLVGTGYIVSPECMDLYIHTINIEASLMTRKENAKITERQPSYPVNKELYSDGPRSLEDAVKVGTDKRLFSDFMDDEETMLEIENEKAESIRARQRAKVYLRQMHYKKEN